VLDALTGAIGGNFDAPLTTALTNMVALASAQLTQQQSIVAAQQVKIVEWTVA
jgi:hypothetical protein